MRILNILFPLDEFLKEHLIALGKFDNQGANTLTNGRKSTQVTGNIGLYYACYQLSQMGWNAMPTARNARGVDIIAYNRDCSCTLSIQVKTLTKITSVILGRTLDNIIGDFWIIINDVKKTPQCYIMLPEEVKRLAKSGERSGKILFWLPTKVYCTSEFHEAWHRIGEPDKNSTHRVINDDGH